jgi:hypothetical protein
VRHILSEINSYTCFYPFTLLSAKLYTIFSLTYFKCGSFTRKITLTYIMSVQCETLKQVHKLNFFKMLICQMHLCISFNEFKVNFMYITLWYHDLVPPKIWENLVWMSKHINFLNKLSNYNFEVIIVISSNHGFEVFKNPTIWFPQGWLHEIFLYKHLIQYTNFWYTLSMDNFIKNWFFVKLSQTDVIAYKHIL